jgi:hypothetical protein
MPMIIHCCNVATPSHPVQTEESYCDHKKSYGQLMMTFFGKSCTSSSKIRDPRPEPVPPAEY